MRDVVNPIKPCEMCRAPGYFSHKFQAVLCDRHFFERNAKPACTDIVQPSTELSKGD
jgi:hypothetical protein